MSSFPHDETPMGVVSIGSTAIDPVERPGRGDIAAAENGREAEENTEEKDPEGTCFLTRKKFSLFEIKRWVIDEFRKLVDLGTPSREVSLGMAVGVFLGWLPIVGIQMITVLVLAVPFKKINKAAAFLGVWISNPFTIMPIYLSIYWVGTFLYPGDKFRSLALVREKLQGVLAAGGPFDQFRACIGLGADVIIPMFIGGGIIGGLSFVPTYMLTRRLVIAYRWKRRRHKRKKALRRLRRRHGV